jgi:hypothetical protein
MHVLLTVGSQDYTQIILLGSRSPTSWMSERTDLAVKISMLAARRHITI